MGIVVITATTLFSALLPLLVVEAVDFSKAEALLKQPVKMVDRGAVAGINLMLPAQEGLLVPVIPRLQVRRKEITAVKEMGHKILPLEAEAGAAVLVQ